ncbi:MAG: TonB-dependent hemoglobin/transferrin/lactoferrin family receptor [Thermoanaerobaculia bacterium]|nr:TonB-dependent hemoglobin/transferrin/lactoferrin family receptor [Thermoanaerobaculia bacterium]
MPTWAASSASDDPPAAAAAKDAVIEPEGEATFLDEVTITAATRSERSLRDTPGQVDVIDEEEIENRGYTGIDDVVRYLPGVYVDGDPTRLGTSGFNIRGIGGNRVLTEIDGVPTAEQFDFGPFSIHQFALDVDALESVEVVRSAGSALYGSDALGGVVSLTTRSPRSYLNGESSYVGLRGGYDGRSEEGSLSGIFAAGGDRVQGSILYTRRDGQEVDNQGTVGSRNSMRTEPNPIDRQQDNALAQISITPDDRTIWRGVVEWYDTEADTEMLSSLSNGSPFDSAIRQSNALDTQQRTRFGLSQELTRDASIFDTLTWRIYTQQSETEQRISEIREPSLGLAEREGLLSFDQDTFGVEGEARKAIGDGALLTYGLSFSRDEFDQLRDRSEFVIDTGAPVPTSLTFPTKYFPQSDIDELGVFLQAELEFFGGKLSLIPGVRFDRYDLDADANDVVFLSGNPGQEEPVDVKEESVSPKLGLVLDLNGEFSLFAQYASGFRAPPMSSVNNGFTNPAGGYRTLPSGDLEAETSDNLELGLRGSFRRGSFSITAFENQYQDFIETVSLGFNPAVFLLEFQPQNVDDVEISGVEFFGQLRFGNGWSARASYAYIDGTNETADEPLESIAPPQLVLGLQYVASDGRWGTELIGTSTEAKDADDLPSGSTQFQTPSYEVFDLVGWYTFNDHLRLQLSAWNLSDETYWRWPFARGQSQTSPVIDRFSSPGRSFGAQLRYTF